MIGQSKERSRIHEQHHYNRFDALYHFPRRGSRFSLSVDDQRIRMWRQSGHRSDPIFVKRHTVITQGVTKWGAICWGTRSPLVILQHTLTAHTYVDDILKPVVLPMLSSHTGALYQQDNARTQTTRLSQQCLPGYDVPLGPARSSNLSPIVLGRHLQLSQNTGELTVQFQRLRQEV
ncbi:DDE_3 domain-containing protein [Trichonephila clavipes]|nr:DDE_3 domain-containing protein [Trichonephila clavipes]